MLRANMSDPMLRGYWPSPWPGEDGGPRRLQRPTVTRGAGRGLALQPGERLAAHSRHDFAFGMVVLRDPSEVFVFGHTMGAADTTSRLERIDPDSLAPVDRSPDLAGGPFWAGGVAAHANGSLYVTYGRWCHRLAPDCSVLAARALPRDRPYNSLLVLPDGHLVMKDFAGGTGVHHLPEEMTGSELVVLAPDDLAVVDRLELPQGSIARLSATTDATPPTGSGGSGGAGAPASGAALIVVGDRDVFRVTWDPLTCRLQLDDDFTRTYLVHEGQTFGWDPVITDTDAWFLDNGEGSANFGPSFRGKGGVSTAPLHLVRVPLDPERAPTFLDVTEGPGGLIANPPAIDPTHGVAVGYDSGHGVLRAWTIADAEPLWSRDQDHAGHMIVFPDTAELVTYDFDHDRGGDDVVVLDLSTGEEKGRVATESPLQSVLFPSVGWGRDLYVTTFTTLTHVTVTPA